MSFLEALILGIIQGLTEFLPVSSSGHLELGKVLLGVTATEDATFEVVVHGATVLSTIVVFRKDLWELFRGLLEFKWNESTKFAALLVFSSIPVIIVGLLFQDHIEALFDQNVVLVGSMLLVTGALLTFTYYAKARERAIGFVSAFIIGLAQTIAVMPGISRSGSTIAVALLLGVNKEKAARFSFLMVLIPILGANAKKIVDGEMASSSVGLPGLAIGFVAAFVTGVIACRLMIRLVSRGKLIHFAWYCFAVGATAIAWSLLK